MKQLDAIEVMMSGENVFLTGAPGAGKTYTLNQFIEEAEAAGKSLAITASTGIAASHIGGVTIHSWSGLGILDELTKDDLRKLVNSGKYRSRYKKTDVLIIDEVSMLHGHRLDMVNTVAKEIRRSALPFGGIQVILVGDLFQLPPVTRGSNIFDFVHLSKSWQELDPRICYITEQHRQEGDDLLLDVLIAMRAGDVQKQHKQLLAHRLNKLPTDQETVTRLYSHNVDVDAINQRHLDELPGKIKTSKMTTSGDPRKVESLQRSVLAPAQLDLKLDAEVMFVANNCQAGFVNGSRGRIIKFKGGDPVVRMVGGRVITVERHSWKMKEDDEVVAEVEQTPLRLAWAITIHKSQGMSLDAAEVDLSKAFTPGMGYVALSRVRSLGGLYLVGVNDVALKMHPEIYELDRQLRADCEALVLEREKS